MPKRKPFVDRIQEVILANKGRITLGELETKLFPEEEYPKAHRSAVQGGPPGCRWMLVAALRRNGFDFWTPAGECNARTVVLAKKSVNQ